MPQVSHYNNAYSLRFVYKHTGTKEYVKKYPTLNTNKRVNNWKILRSGNAKYPGYFFIGSQAYSDIFKSALVYL